MKEIRFIHTADLHLDTPFRGLMTLPKDLYEKIENSTFIAFENVVQTAIKEQCDFIIIVGDLYDVANRSLRAQSFMKKQCQKLLQYEIDVFIVHGNHDHLSGNWTTFTWPTNVYFFSDEVECKAIQTKSGAIVHLYGFSYPKRDVYENIVPYYKKIDPADFHIGILHGQVEGASNHAPYAPFQVSELVEKQFDYWALGHIHTYMRLDPTIYYPGNIQGRHIKETGEKGCLLVTLSEWMDEPNVEFKPTASIIWEKLYVSIEEIETVEQLRHQIEEQLAEIAKEAHFVLCHLQFCGHGLLHSFLSDKDEVHEFLAIINEEVQFNYDVWIVNYENDTIPLIDREFYKQKDDFIGDLLKVSDRYQVDDQEKIFQDLFKHRRAKKYLENFSEKEFNQIKNDAELTILSFLLKE